MTKDCKKGTNKPHDKSTRGLIKVLVIFSDFFIWQTTKFNYFSYQRPLKLNPLPYYYDYYYYYPLWSRERPIAELVWKLQKRSLAMLFCEALRFKWRITGIATMLYGTNVYLKRRKLIIRLLDLILYDIEDFLPKSCDATTTGLSDYTQISSRICVTFLNWS